MLVRGLRKEEDAIVQHYVSQTLDNLASQNNDYVVKLATYELVSALMSVVGFAQVGTLIELICWLVGLID